MQEKTFINFIILLMFLPIVFIIIVAGSDRFAKLSEPATNKLSSENIPSPPASPNPVLPTSKLTPVRNNKKITKNVAIVIINPPDTGGSGIIEKYNWKKPETLARQYIEAVKTASHQTVEYKISETVEYNSFPEKKSGFILDHDYYKNCLTAPDAKCREIINYKKFFDSLNLCDKISGGSVNEIWAFGGPWFGFWEWSVRGIKINSLQENLPLCGNKTYTVMGFSYERTVAEMLENLGHRIEATMPFYTSEKSNWNIFGTKNYCGSAHVPPNGVRDYDWGNTNPVFSSCDSFYNYPVMAKKEKELSCYEWGCTGLGYLKWWLGHLPEAWWSYVIDPDNRID